MNSRATTETEARRGVTVRVMFHGSQRPRERNEEWEDRLVDRLLVRMVERRGQEPAKKGRGQGPAREGRRRGQAKEVRRGKRVRKVSGNEGREERVGGGVTHGG